MVVPKTFTHTSYIRTQCRRIRIPLVSTPPRRPLSNQPYLIISHHTPHVESKNKANPRKGKEFKTIPIEKLILLFLLLQKKIKNPRTHVII